MCLDLPNNNTQSETISVNINSFRTFSSDNTFLGQGEIRIDINNYLLIKEGILKGNACQKLLKAFKYVYFLNHSRKQASKN